MVSLLPTSPKSAPRLTKIFFTASSYKTLINLIEIIVKMLSGVVVVIVFWKLKKGKWLFILVCLAFSEKVNEINSLFLNQ